MVARSCWRCRGASIFRHCAILRRGVSRRCFPSMRLKHALSMPSPSLRRLSHRKRQRSTIFSPETKWKTNILAFLGFYLALWDIFRDALWDNSVGLHCSVRYIMWFLCWIILWDVLWDALFDCYVGLIWGCSMVLLLGFVMWDFFVDAKLLDGIVLWDWSEGCPVWVLFEMPWGMLCLIALWDALHPRSE